MRFVNYLVAAINYGISAYAMNQRDFNHAFFFLGTAIFFILIAILWQDERSK